MTPAPDAGPDATGAWDALLRAEFARAARDVTPGPAPVAAVVRAGRARRRRRTAALSFLAVLGVSAAVAAGTAMGRGPHPAGGLAAPPVRSAADATVPAPGAPAVPRASASPSSAASGRRVPAPVRTVAAGERVTAAPGWKVWLTDRGKHWEGGEDGLEQFRSVIDGNVDLARPGISHQGEGTFHSGLYYGTRDAGRVELVEAGGRTTAAALLELPGRPGWGVWYAVARDGSAVGLRLYDRAGRLLSELPPL
ncbi:hypothetical protein ACI2LJ_07300 [Streptomyces sp. NPDC088090]|uniref:hypothetical protein n=1 Tax=Streptomyces sp. NPDC088090 TaxID=3365822 RepID=UPI00384A8152